MGMLSNRKPKSDDNLTGLNGWLILVGIGLFFYLIRTTLDLLLSFLPYFTDDTLKALTSPTSPTYNAPMTNLIIGQSVVGIALWIATVVAIFLFFKRKKIFPRFFITLYVLYPLNILISGLVAIALLPNKSFENVFVSEVGGSLIAKSIFSAIWIAYMLRSRRVRLTFIN